MNAASDVTPDLIAERLARFERTRDPASLWPGLGEPARVAAARELERVARSVLAGVARVAIDPPSAHDAYALGIAGHTTGMGPVVGRWIEDGRVVVRSDVARVFAEHLAQSRKRAARMEREVLPAIDALLARAITPVALKGFHTARSFFDEPGARRMNDVDLLIPADRVRDAEAALAGAGFSPETAPLRPYKRDWIAAGADQRLFSIELAHEQSKWILELHASLDRSYHPGSVARLDAEHAGVEPFDVAGRSLLALAPPLLLVYLACHCSQELDGIRLLRVVEMANVIRRERASHGFDWDEVMAILRRTGAARFTYPAFALVEDLAPGTVDERALDLGARASTWAARHTVARLAPAGGSLDDRGVLRQLMWTRGPLSILQRLLRVVWPASFERPRDVIPGWKVRLRRLWSGGLTLRAPNERR